VTSQLNGFDIMVNVTVGDIGPLNAAAPAWATGTTPLPFSDLSGASLDAV
jgi:hypothetical protein